MCPACLLRLALRGANVTRGPTALLAAAQQAELPMEGSGSMVGRYKLLEQIGEGGFGIVYLAQQTEPVKRHVALKILKPGMDSREVVTRFEAERQALALMDHPGIAHVFDGGTTAEGRPYFAMELVPGAPITRHCDEAKLGTRQRLKVFLEVLAAVQHAHQKGIIHRDLKPSNILVSMIDGVPTAKVIDFGVAKAIGMELTERTLFTGFGRMVGTPQYMSPEQTDLKLPDVDTRSDLYSLGVVLYELLTGCTPLDAEKLRAAGYDEMQRMIREEEPHKPSTRISTLGESLTEVARSRRTEPMKLSREIRGDLDWIVMKALEKDRGARYETAGAFAADLQRHLCDEAVEARPPSRIYRLQKLMRRNKGAVVATVVVLITLLVGVAASMWQGLRAREEAAISKAVREFLEKDLLGSASPDREPDRDLRVRTVLDRASDKVKHGFQGQPLVEAALRATLGHAYVELAELSKALEHLNRSYEIREKILGAEHSDTLSSRDAVARLIARMGRGAQAEEELRSVVAVRERLQGAEHRDTLSSRVSLADAMLRQEKPREAATEIRAVIPVAERVLGVRDSVTLDARTVLAQSLFGQQRLPEAATEFRLLLDMQRHAHGPESSRTLELQSQLAAVHRAQEKYSEAEAGYREVLAIKERVFGPTNPSTVFSRRDLAWTYVKAQKFAEADVNYRAVLEVLMTDPGPDGKETLATWITWADVLRELGRPDEAEAEARKVLERSRRALGEEHWVTDGGYITLGVALATQGRLAEADVERRKALEIRERVYGSNHENTITAVFILADSLFRQEKYEEARAFAQRALNWQRKYRGLDHSHTQDSQRILDLVAQKLGTP
jgi:serine/threonine protein kinase